MSARDERLAVPGLKGDKGEPGMTRGTRQAVIFLFCLSFALSAAGLLWTSHSVSTSQAAQARILASSQAGLASTRALCLDSNQAGERQVLLWQFILRLGKPPRTAAQRLVITRFEAYLHTAFAPRNCAALGQHR